MLMLCNTSAMESIEIKGSQGNSERRTFVKKPDAVKVSTRAAAAYGQQLISHKYHYVFQNAKYDFR